MRIAAALFAAISLTGCTVTIDESTVFRPEPRDSVPNGLDFLENVFTTPTNVTITSDANGEKARIFRSQADFVPADVTHDSLKIGEDRIAYTLIARSDPSRPVIVYCGGNAADRYNSGTGYALEAIPYGDVILFDYPGYGDSTGTPSAASFAAMIAPVSRFAASQAGERPLVFWGHSLGGFVCAELAVATPEADGLIFEASARNADEVARAWTPRFAGPFVRLDIAPSLAGYDNAAAAAAFGKPVLVLGGEDDRTLPVRLSRRLAEATQAQGGEVRYIEFPDGNHINLAQQPGFTPAVSAYFNDLRSD